MLERALDVFDPDLVEVADALEKEATRRRELGAYHAALPAAARALTLRFRTVGRTAVQTLMIQLLKAQILDGLGRYDEALVNARAVAEEMENNPELGPSFPLTLASRYVVAHVLNSLGRSAEALRIARAVAEAMEANPGIGPSHPATLSSSGLTRRHCRLLPRSQKLGRPCSVRWSDQL